MNNLRRKCEKKWNEIQIHEEYTEKLKFEIHLADNKGEVEIQVKRDTTRWKRSTFREQKQKT